MDVNQSLPLIDRLNQDYHLTAAAVIIFLILTAVQWGLFRWILGEKEKEIKRVCRARDRLQEIFIRDHISSKTETSNLLDRLSALEKDVLEKKGQNERLV